MEITTLLDVRHLKLWFRSMRGRVQAVDDVSFGLVQGRTMVVVGESGCGKTSLMRAILRLLPRNVHTYSGEVILQGANLMEYSDERFRRQVRWLQIAFVPQGAMNSMNPVVRVEDQVAEPLLVHDVVQDRRQAADKAREAFGLVGVPVDFLHRYPFELSGGMRQRAAIATALVTNPALVVLDEPTSALDVLTQASVMNVLKRIKRELGMTFIWITHDIAISSELADDVAVMYAGQIVELSDADRFYREPLHPYSRKLMASVPTLREDKELSFIPGQPPSLYNPPRGCRFADRCPEAHGRCAQEPPFVPQNDGRHVKCWLYADEVKHYVTARS